MIIQEVHIREYDWDVDVYYDANEYYINTICRELNHLNAPQSFIDSVRIDMINESINTGFTYTNFEKRKTIMVINKTSSKNEFVNSVAHESQHLIAHISNAFGIDRDSEEICYLAGTIAELLYPISSEII